MATDKPVVNTGTPVLDALAYEEFVRLTVEALFHKYSAAVHGSMLYRGRSGHDHQIDASVDLTLGGLRILILFECKHYKRAVGVEDLLAFAQRLNDIGANKGVVVTTIGFQEGATKIADAHHIALVTTTTRTPHSPRDFIIELANYALPRTIDPDRGDTDGRPRTIRLVDERVRSLPFDQAWPEIIHTLAEDVIDELDVTPTCPQCKGVDLTEVGPFCPNCKQLVDTTPLHKYSAVQCGCCKITCDRKSLRVYTDCACGKRLESDREFLMFDMRKKLKARLP